MHSLPHIACVAGVKRGGGGGGGAKCILKEGNWDAYFISLPLTIPHLQLAYVLQNLTKQFLLGVISL